MKQKSRKGISIDILYLPAVILGCLLLVGMMHLLSPVAIAAVTVLLYLIGTGGDSYYQLVSQIPALKMMYQGIFTISSYTRNGIFFAPVFFVLGGWIADAQTRIRPAVSWTMCIVMLLFMLAEGLLLHHFQVQRHDSMYFFLLPVMYFLFQLLLEISGKAPAWIRNGSMVLYIIHPAVIVAHRLIAKVTGLTKILVDNS